MRYGIRYHISDYGTKGNNPYRISQELDSKQMYDDFLHELRKSVRTFVKELLQCIEDTPFKVTLYCIAEANYVSIDARPFELTPKLPKDTSLFDFWDVLLEILNEVDLKYEIFLSPQHVSDRFILQISSMK